MAHLTLQTRQRKLLGILKTQQRLITGAELAKKLDVSDRTIRNDILYLNSVLPGYGACIEAQRGKGYFLQMKDGAHLQTLFNRGLNLQTREERARYLTLLLLVSDCSYPLDELEDIFFVSHTTLENDIRYMQSQYSQKLPRLRFVRRGSSIRCEDDERKRRTVLSKLFVEEWDSHSQIGLNFCDDLMEPEDFDTILEQVKRSIGRYAVKVDDYGMMDVVFTIAIARIRITAGHELQETDSKFSVDAHLLRLVDELADGLEEIWHIRFHHAEREEIARTLQLRQTFDWKITTREDLKKYVDPSRIEVIEKLLGEIRDLYGLDLMQDEELIISLTRHVMSMVGRVRFRYERRSAVLQTMKNEFPLVMDYALLFQSYFLKDFQYEIGEDEISFIASHLLSAIDRHNHLRYRNGIPVAFVSHLNLSASRTMMLQIKAVFGSNIDFKGPFSIYEEEAVRGSGCLFALSTVQLDQTAVSIPSLMVTFPFGQEDILRISRMLKWINQRMFFPALPKPLESYFEEELFFRGLEADTPEEAIRSMAGKLAAKGYVPENFAEALLRRETVCSTAFDCGAAMPRAIRRAGNRTGIAAATLKNPVWWGSQKVQCVLMLATKEEDFRYNGHFLYLGMHINEDKSMMGRLLAADSLDEFLKAIF